MLRLACLLALSLGACAPALSPSDAAPPDGASGVDYPDRPLVVMNLAAHPDDEDGQTLATYRGHHDAVAYSVIYTRGEGGQNEAGPDLYERLGAVRTRETEAAARILGTQVTFLNFYDFGFSKHADEAFDEWSRPRRGFWDTDAGRLGTEAGRDAVTAEIVRLVRRLKPDVLFTNHDTRTAWPDAQHGQHQVVGLTAEAAFALAADPAYRPEQLDEEGVDLWQPARLFVRTRGFSPGVPDAYDVAVPVSVPCAPIADGPAELCSDRGVRAVSEHVSQGFDVFAPRFRRDTTYFVLTQAAPGAAPLPDGATDLGAGLSPTVRELTVGALVDTGRIRPLPGLTVDDATVLAGDTTTVRPPADAGPIALVDAATARRVGLGRLGEAAVSGPQTVRIAPGTPPSAPLYAAQYDRRTGGAAPLYVAFRNGEPAFAGRLPLDVVPPLVLDLDPGPVELRPTTVLDVAVTPYDPRAAAVRVHAALDPTATSTEDIDTEAMTLPAEATTARIPLSVPSTLAPGRYVATLSGALDTSDAPAQVTRPAVRLPDVAVAPGLRVGLVRSYDDATEAGLRRMGATVVPLDSAALAAGAFDGLDTIVIDIRAGLVRGDLRAHADRIWAWVEGGGHLVVGYHKSFEWNLDRDNPVTGEPNAAVVPLPIRLNRERVVDETAEVTLLRPEHPVFTAPHRIAPADWDGWVQERGLYFPATWDPAYVPLVSLGDPGEAPLTGGLLLADYGRGTVAYSALVWYRQLAALHGGAHRVFANLVSLPLTDGR